MVGHGRLVTSFPVQLCWSQSPLFKAQHPLHVCGCTPAKTKIDKMPGMHAILHHDLLPEALQVNGEPVPAARCELRAEWGPLVAADCELAWEHGLAVAAGAAHIVSLVPRQLHLGAPHAMNACT